MLVRWADGTNDSSPKHLTFQVFFFINSYRLRALKTLYFHFCNFIKKIIERVFAKNFARFYEKKNNTWNIRHLFDELFVPSAQGTSVLYCKLTDFSYLVWFWFWLVVLILVHPAPHLIWLFGLHLVPFFGGLAVWRTLFCVWLECGLFLFVATPTRWQHRFMVTWHLMFLIVHRATVPKSGTFAHTSGFVLVLLLFYLVLKWVDK